MGQYRKWKCLSKNKSNKPAKEMNNKVMSDLSDALKDSYIGKLADALRSTGGVGSP